MKFLVIVKEYRDISGFVSDRVLLDCSHQILDYEHHKTKIKSIMGRFLFSNDNIDIEKLEMVFDELKTIDYENSYEVWKNYVGSSYSDKLEIMKL